LRAVRLQDSAGRTGSQIFWKQPFSVQVDYDVVEPAKNCQVWVSIRDELNQEVICTTDLDATPHLKEQRRPGRYSASVTFPGAVLNAGYYTVAVGLQRVDPLQPYVRVQDVSFAIVHTPADGVDEFQARGGAIKMQLPWTLAERRNHPAVDKRSVDAAPAALSVQAYERSR
jgi:hypothetical protein